MSIYPVCKAVVTNAAILTLALITAACSQPNANMGSENSAAIEAAGGVAPTTAGQKSSQSSAQASETGQPTDADTGKKGVRTNHDVFHSRGLEVPAGTPVPAISIEVNADNERGWNLYVGTANFEFSSPEDVGGESSPTAGHGELYINDKPSQRIYGTWTHLPELPAGKTEIRVTLNANGNETLTTQGEPIEESVIVEVYDPNASQN